eukprot:g21277.t1
MYLLAKDLSAAIIPEYPQPLVLLLRTIRNYWRTQTNKTSSASPMVTSTCQEHAYSTHISPFTDAQQIPVPTYALQSFMWKDWEILALHRLTLITFAETTAQCTGFHLCFFNLIRWWDLKRTDIERQEKIKNDTPPLRTPRTIRVLPRPTAPEWTLEQFLTPRLLTCGSIWEEVMSTLTLSEEDTNRQTICMILSTANAIIYDDMSISWDILQLIKRRQDGKFFS